MNALKDIFEWQIEIFWHVAASLPKFRLDSNNNKRVQEQQPAQQCTVQLTTKACMEKAMYNVHFTSIKLCRLIWLETPFAALLLLLLDEVPAGCLDTKSELRTRRRNVAYTS